MKKLAILFAFMIFASTVSFAQFKLDSYKCGTVSNSKAPDDTIYGKDASGESKIFEYYYDWKENYVRIQVVRYLSEINDVEEYYLHFEDVKDQTAKITAETSYFSSKKNKPRFTVVSNKPIPRIIYSSGYCVKSTSAMEIKDLPFANGSDFQGFIKKLQDKAFDMALNLEKEYKRFDVETASSSEYDDTSTPRDTSASNENNTSSNNSSPEAKTEIWLRLWNKSDGEIDIAYESRGAGGSKTQTSISRRSTKSVKMKVGGRVFGANGAVLLTVTAAMEDTEQVIFK